jgi:SPP1 family predicted phage head-tail adaptor
MRAEKYDQRIRIEVKQATPDPDYGTPVITWATFVTVWAQVQDVLPSKAETQSTGVRVSTRPARIRTRYLGGVTTDMRVVLLSRGNRVLQIISGPAELGRKEGLEFMAEEYSTDGRGS